MKKIILINLLFLLVFTLSIEAKSSKGSVGKAIVNKISKSIPKIKKMISASKASKIKARIKIKKNVPKITGIYKFKASNNKPYLGKSVKTKNQNVQNRLIQHVNSGKLHPKDVKTISYAKVDKKDVSKVEKLKIMKADKDTRGNLANKQHAPRSYSKQKREALAEEISKNKSLYKSKL